MITFVNAVTLTGLAAATALMSATALGANLVVDGKVASTSVRMIDGVAYVKVSDIAKSIGRVVAKRPGGYELIEAGGANQIAGVVKGKIGDQLFDGKWRFKVTGVETASTYALKTQGEPYSYGSDVSYNTSTRTFSAPAADTLIIVRCAIANGQKTKQTFWVAEGGSNTALTDDQGHAFTPIAYDFSGAPAQTEPLLPGSKMEFPVIFCIPAGTQLKDLIFTLRNNDASSKGNDVRVSLSGG
ncbi:hypothetical protein CCAX7_63480 [Capsulimonas corticalis]|uniref:Uncharacterized protein n=1 Tax=Capsulimonas corticalis TaxID=2219043 RepID=A0A402CWV9_9BACT|nr:hypothetical protein [Capsulimonas corticalis]BDI34297.1 hypothetical protein CCAX7_63480 [Capsulimonas corticalis]